MSNVVSVISQATVAARDYQAIFNDILSLDMNPSSCTLTVCLASVGKDEAIPSFERLQMTEKLTKGFCETIEMALKKYQKETKASDLLFPEFHIDSKPEDFEMEHLDLTQYSAILEQINPLASLTDIEVFTKKESFVAGLRFYVIVVQIPNQEPAYFFRTHTPKKILSRSWLLGLQRNDGTFDRVEEPLILFDQEIDCMSHKGMIYLIDKKNFENIFRFFDAIRVTAKETLETINISIPIQNFDELVRTCEGNLQMLRKLKKIASKPNLKNIQMSDVKKVIEQLNLPIQVVDVNGQEKLLFDLKATAREKYALLRLLNDDYLQSIMTGKKYEVTGKREV